ncbi:hypothetical protein [Nocardia miyunensis]|uniref:hypothetical protein n=1 Tax=Nocardia miyunensis TaxID=282684 RepID=UPI00083370F3|nr:hypothetical protein [Nocardia miyunensis]
MALTIALRRYEALGRWWTDADLAAGTADIAQALYRADGSPDLHDLKPATPSPQCRYPMNWLGCLVE